MIRYVVKEDRELEEYKIVDTGRVVGTERELIATVYDQKIANYISYLLDNYPWQPRNKPLAIES